MYLHHNQSSRTELATSIKLLYKCIRSNLKLGTPRVQLEQILLLCQLPDVPYKRNAN